MIFLSKYYRIQTSTVLARKYMQRKHNLLVWIAGTIDVDTLVNIFFYFLSKCYFNKQKDVYRNCFYFAIPYYTKVCSLAPPCGQEEECP